MNHNKNWLERQTHGLGLRAKLKPAVFIVGALVALAGCSVVETIISDEVFNQEDALNYTEYAKSTGDGRVVKYYKARSNYQSEPGEVRSIYKVEVHQDGELCREWTQDWKPREEHYRCEEY